MAIANYAQASAERCGNAGGIDHEIRVLPSRRVWFGQQAEPVSRVLGINVAQAATAFHHAAFGLGRGQQVDVDYRPVQVILVADGLIQKVVEAGLRGPPHLARAFEVAVTVEQG